MKGLSTRTLHGSAALLGAIVLSGLVLPAVVHTQSGSRLCGWTLEVVDAKLGPVQTLGALYEARQDDASYTTKCNTAINDSKSALQKKGLPYTFDGKDGEKNKWVQQNKDTCEHVGALFTSAYKKPDGKSDYSSTDMCDNMAANKGYQVTKLFYKLGADGKPDMSSGKPVPFNPPVVTYVQQ